MPSEAAYAALNAAYVAGNVPLANQIAKTNGVTAALGATRYGLSAASLAEIYRKGYRWADQQGALGGLSPAMMIGLAVVGVLAWKKFAK